jgi:seryl-tRNA synthetase
MESRMRRTSFISGLFVLLVLPVALCGVSRADAPAAEAQQAAPQRGDDGDNELIERREMREERQKLRDEHEALETEGDKLNAACAAAGGTDEAACAAKQQALHQKMEDLHKRIVEFHEKAATARRELGESHESHEPGGKEQTPQPAGSAAPAHM